MRSNEDKREAKKGSGDEIPRRVWAAAQRSSCVKRQSTRVGEEPKATITTPLYFNRISVQGATGYALRWAQKDEGEIRISPYIPLDSHTPFRNAWEV